MEMINQETIEKYNRDLEFLIQCLQEVLEELGESELSKLLRPETLNETIHISKKHVQVFSILFQLMNMVEENTGNQHRRKMETEKGLTALEGLWGARLKQLVDEGWSEEELCAEFRNMRVEPVLTAHPTEAKRATVLQCHRELYLLLVKLENTMWTPTERRALRRDVKALLERLWRTGEIYLEKPDLSSELKNVFHYLLNVFPEALPQLDRHLREAWKELGFNPLKLTEPNTLPKISFGNWVGGDRDGHPFVTAEVTRKTLLELRSEAIKLLENHLNLLGTQLSLSDTLQIPPISLLNQLERVEELMGDFARQVMQRNPRESWRQWVNIITVRLPSVDSTQANKFGCKPEWQYQSTAEINADLVTLRNSLLSVGAKRLANDHVLKTIRLVETFGFHLASLDVRQNSAFHDRAMEQLMQEAGLPDTNFSQWDEAKRREFLNEELKTPRPFAIRTVELPKEADAVMQCYRVLRKHRQYQNNAGLGALLVSMTRDLSDLIVVYALAREAGLAFNTPEGLVCPLPVAPLFETIDDLHRSPQILDEFLSHPITQRSLKYIQELEQHPRPVQQIMIGYSDSCKDGGILASNWNLFRGQKNMVAVAEKHGVALRFFHGRGGSISRGAGPTNRFLEALPVGSIQGNLRLTEQGETIAQKYANLLNATYNLEYLLAGVTGVSIQQKRRTQEGNPLEATVARLADESARIYRELISEAGFIRFYEQTTPIDAIESSKIGSRPSRRSGTRTLGDLRAIPWVFSWNQARYNLPNWYGVGSALESVCSENESLAEQLSAQLKEWPFLNNMFFGIDLGLFMVSPEIMQMYAELVEDETIRSKFYQKIMAEFDKSRQWVDRILGGTIEQREPHFYHIHQRRYQPLKELHRRQVELLREWRGKNDDPARKEMLLTDLLLTINAIAGGLKTTG